jgi:hypothetical protein
LVNKPLESSSDNTPVYITKKSRRSSGHDEGGHAIDQVATYPSYPPSFGGHPDREHLNEATAKLRERNPEINVTPISPCERHTDHELPVIKMELLLQQRKATIPNEGQSLMPIV